MNDGDLKRLIVADIARGVDGAINDVGLGAAMAADRRKQTLKRAIIALALIATTIALLSAGYSLAARVLPPIELGGFDALLWAPMVLSGVLVLIALRSALSALAER